MRSTPPPLIPGSSSSSSGTPAPPTRSTPPSTSRAIRSSRSCRPARASTPRASGACATSSWRPPNRSPPSPRPSASTTPDFSRRSTKRSVSRARFPWDRAPPRSPRPPVPPGHSSSIVGACSKWSAASARTRATPGSTLRSGSSASSAPGKSRQNSVPSPTPSPSRNRAAPSTSSAVARRASWNRSDGTAARCSARALPRSPAPRSGSCCPRSRPR